MTSLEIGTPLPDFTLPGISASGRGEFTLSAERGHPVVIAFYPGDDTPVCTKQLCSYERDLALLNDTGAVVWGISAQDLDSHERFAAKQGLTFPLLSDVDKQVHRLFGLGGLLDPHRSVYVADATGRLVWKHESRLGLTYQRLDTIAEALQASATHRS